MIVKQIKPGTYRISKIKKTDQLEQVIDTLKATNNWDYVTVYRHGQTTALHSSDKIEEIIVSEF